MKKNLVVLKICIIFAAVLVFYACTSMRFSAKACHPKVGCLGVELETKCDTCK